MQAWQAVEAEFKSVVDGLWSQSKKFLTDTGQMWSQEWSATSSASRAVGSVVGGTLGAVGSAVTSVAGGVWGVVASASSVVYSSQSDTASPEHVRP